MSIDRSSPAVGFVGLGNMGGPLAERLIGRTALAVFDTAGDRTAAFAAKGAAVSRDGADLARRSEIVFLCLPSSAHVAQSVFGDGTQAGLAAGLAPGALVVDMTTGDPGETRRIAAELSARSVGFIDAPVSGGPRGAREGTIAIIVGAGEAQFTRVAPLLAHISRNVFHAGPVGTGHAIKAGNNLLNLICRLATFEVVSMLVKDGVDPAAATAIIQKSSGRNYATEITLPDNILSGTLMQGFTTALMQKDSNLALDMARRMGLDMPFGALARATLDRVVAEHGLAADMSTVALTYERETGARIRP